MASGGVKDADSEERRPLVELADPLVHHSCGTRDQSRAQTLVPRKETHKVFTPNTQSTIGLQTSDNTPQLFSAKGHRCLPGVGTFIPEVAVPESGEESNHLDGLPQTHLVTHNASSLLNMQLPQPLHPGLLIS